MNAWEEDLIEKRELYKALMRLLDEILNPQPPPKKCMVFSKQLFDRLVKDYPGYDPKTNLLCGAYTVVITDE